MITRRCDYALRIIRAACACGGERRTIAEIAETEDIPYSFARTIQNDLMRGGIVKTTRGAGGGLELACDPGEVSVLDVVRLVQGPLSLSPCVVNPEECGKSAQCTYHAVWCGAEALLDRYLDGIMLGDILGECS